MEKYNNLPDNLLDFCGLPFKNVPITTRVWFSQHLNPEKSTLGPTSRILQDWRGVAEELGFTNLQIDNFQRFPDPLSEVMKNLPIHKSRGTVGDFLLAISKCERFDILEDPDLIILLARYPKDICTALPVEPVQDPKIDSPGESREYFTVGEVETGEPEHFNAYVCYAPEDLEFVRHMIHELEEKEKLKLCIPERDFLPGPAKYDAITKLIKGRCYRMIVVLSPDFSKSEECKFLMNFAVSLAPGAMEKKLVPVVFRICEIPTVLNHITLVDYTRSDVIEWFWSRLSRSLKITFVQHPPTYSSTSSLPSYRSLPSLGAPYPETENSRASNNTTKLHSNSSTTTAGTFSPVGCSVAKVSSQPQGEDLFDTVEDFLPQDSSHSFSSVKPALITRFFKRF